MATGPPVFGVSTDREPMAKTAQWANRITSYADVDPSQLLANPKNFRRHPRTQQDALSGVIGEIGYLDPVLVQRGSDRVIDGHLRIELAMRANQATIPVAYVDLTDAEADLALATYDPISSLAYADVEQLKALLDDVSTGDAAVMQMLSELAQKEGIVPPDGFLSDALGSGDGADPWPSSEGSDQNSMTIPVTPEQRDAIMAAVKRAKKADVSIATTTDALVSICEAY